MMRISFNLMYARVWVSLKRVQLFQMTVVRLESLVNVLRESSHSMWGELWWKIMDENDIAFIKNDEALLTKLFCLDRHIHSLAKLFCVETYMDNLFLLNIKLGFIKSRHVYLLIAGTSWTQRRTEKRCIVFDWSVMSCFMLFEHFICTRMTRFRTFSCSGTWKQINGSHAGALIWCASISCKMRKRREIKEITKTSHSRVTQYFDIYLFIRI